MTIAPLCEYPSPYLLVFSSNVSPIVYYSHLPIIIISLFLGFFVLFSDKRKLANLLLFFTLITFGTWVFLDSIFWAANRSDIIMFVWAAILLVEPMVYAGCLYMLHVLVDKKDISFPKKMLIAGLFLPLILLLPSMLSLQGFDITNCLAIEGPLALYYTYAIEIFFSLWIITFAIRRYRAIKDAKVKRQIIYLATGILLFLVAFASGNIIGSTTENWNIAQLGLFGMPIFAIFLVYSIVRYQTFNIKLLATQALVVALVVLVGAQFAFIQNQTNMILNGITFVGAIVFGVFLVKSVKREVEQRQRLEKLTLALETANEKLKSVDKLKTEFLSLASHQLRSPITAIKGYTSMLLEGSYGKASPEQTEAISRVFQSSQNLAKVVEDLLDVAKIEQGGMKYVFEKTDFEKICHEVYNELSITAKGKGIELQYDSTGASPAMISADGTKIRQVVLNLVDNSIKYTPKGFVKLTLKKTPQSVIMEITDSGIGMGEETKKKLFGKFNRGEGQKVNAGGSGLGLYLVKELVESHKGTVTADSEGEGKGSIFTVTLPAA